MLGRLRNTSGRRRFPTPSAAPTRSVRGGHNVRQGGAPVALAHVRFLAPSLRRAAIIVMVAVIWKSTAPGAAWEVRASAGRRASGPARWRATVVSRRQTLVTDAMSGAAVCQHDRRGDGRPRYARGLVEDAGWSSSARARRGTCAPSSPRRPDSSSSVTVGERYRSRLRLHAARGRRRRRAVEASPRGGSPGSNGLESFVPAGASCRTDTARGRACALRRWAEDFGTRWTSSPSWR